MRCLQNCTIFISPLPYTSESNISWSFWFFCPSSLGFREPLWLQLSDIVSCFVLVCFGPLRTLWLRLLSTIWFFCLSTRASWGLSGFSCWVLFVFSVCQPWAREDSGSSCWYCLDFVFVFWSLRGLFGSSCLLMSGFSIRQLRASGDSLSPAVGCCQVFLLVNFGPQWTISFRLLGAVWSFCMSPLGVREIFWLQFLGSVWSYCLAGSGFRGLSASIRGEPGCKLCILDFSASIRGGPGCKLCILACLHP